MREVNGYFLFQMGQIWQLAMLPLKKAPKQYLGNIGLSISFLKTFINADYNQNDLLGSVNKARILLSLIDQLVEQPEQKLTSDILINIIHHIFLFQEVLEQELGKLYVVILEEIRGYGVKTLWKNQMNLLRDEIIPYLSDFVKENFIEAAKCLVLNCYTAVGFHAMRSIECVARKYYGLVIGKQPIIIHNLGKENEKHQDMGLGQIANDLISRYDSFEKNKPRKKYSGNLGIIGVSLQALCKNYRDPLSHPEIKELDKDQAITTFNLTKEVISNIIMDAKNGGQHINPPWEGEDF
jgi:hypothetical protein